MINSKTILIKEYHRTIIYQEFKTKNETSLELLGIHAFIIRVIVITTALEIIPNEKTTVIK